MAQRTMVGNVETLDIAGHTTSEVARLWLSKYTQLLTDAIKEDSDVVADGVVSAEVLNTQEQVTWEHFRSAFGAFGFDAEAEDAVSDFVSDWRNDGTLKQAIYIAIVRAS